MAAIGLGDQVECNAASGYLLGPGDSASTDPDGDLEGLAWIVDGVAASHDAPLRVGWHELDLLAVDARGAHDRAGPRGIEVVRGPECL